MSIWYRRKEPNGIRWFRDVQNTSALAKKVQGGFEGFVMDNTTDQDWKSVGVFARLFDAQSAAAKAQNEMVRAAIDTE